MLYPWLIDTFTTLHSCESLEVMEHTNLLIQQMFIKPFLCAVAMQGEVYCLLPWTKQSIEKETRANESLLDKDSSCEDVNQVQ